MAHKGKLYPYFAARDLSLKPGGYCYLPAEWIWSGVLCSGSKAALLHNVAHRLIYPPGAIPYQDEHGWFWKVETGPFQFLSMFVYYNLTHQPNMSQIRFEIADEVGTLMTAPYKDTTTSFPFNQMHTVYTCPRPSALNVGYPGVCIPAPW